MKNFVSCRNTVHGSGFSLPAKQKLGFDLLDSTSPDRQPSPNPFAELSSDFPNVMGEGIGFDPLSYRSVRQQAPLWKGKLALMECMNNCEVVQNLEMTFSKVDFSRFRYKFFGENSTVAISF